MSKQLLIDLTFFMLNIAIVVEVLVKTKQKITYSHSLTDDLSDLDSWTRNLVGVVDLGSEDPKESYIDYLVEKYR
jgi:hypothetical protein